MGNIKNNQSFLNNNDDDENMLNSFLLNNIPKMTDGLNKEQIDQIKEDCLRSLKERLVQRLNIITRRLHSEIELLEKTKIKYETYDNNINNNQQQNDQSLLSENDQILNEEKENKY